MTNAPGKVPLSARIAVELDDWLREEAARQERSISWIVERALKNAKAKSEKA